MTAVLRSIDMATFLSIEEIPAYLEDTYLVDSTVTDQAYEAVQLQAQGQARMTAIAIGVTAGLAVYTWKSPLGKQLRTKIAAAIKPAESV